MHSRENVFTCTSSCTSFHARLYSARLFYDRLPSTRRLKDICAWIHVIQKTFTCSTPSIHLRLCSFMYRRGGADAKRRRTAAGLAGMKQQNHLGGHLIYLCSWGFLSLPMVCRLARLASDDLTVARTNPSVIFDDLDMLKGLGSDGKYPGNMYGELMRQIEKPLLPRPVNVPFHYKSGPNTVHETEMPVLAPHAVFAHLYHNYPDRWKAIIAPSQDVIEQFWDDMQGHPLFEEINLRSRPGYRQKAVAVKLHGDGVPITAAGKTWVKLMDVFSWRRQQTYLHPI